MLPKLDNPDTSDRHPQAVAESSRIDAEQTAQQDPNRCLVGNQQNIASGMMLADFLNYS